MEHNVGMADRYIRIALGSFLLAGSAARMARRADAGAVVLGLLGGTMLAEGTLGVCPLYEAFGFSTNRMEHPESDNLHEPPPGMRTNDDIMPYEGI